MRLGSDGCGMDRSEFWKPESGQSLEYPMSVHTRYAKGKKSVRRLFDTLQPGDIIRPSPDMGPFRIQEGEEHGTFEIPLDDGRTWVLRDEDEREDTELEDIWFAGSQLCEMAVVEPVDAELLDYTDQQVQEIFPEKPDEEWDITWEEPIETRPGVSLEGEVYLPEEPYGFHERTLTSEHVYSSTHENVPPGTLFVSFRPEGGKIESVLIPVDLLVDVTPSESA